MKIYLNGQLVPKEEARVSVFDHGLLYGDGVFEGIRFYAGRVFRLEEHLDRLYRSARAIALEIPIDREAMSRAVLDTIRANEMLDGYVRLVVTRGEGSLGLSPKSCPTPTIFIIAAGISLYPEAMYQSGLKLVTCGTRRIAHGALSPMVKSLNYLNNIMAKIEAEQAGAGEGLMLNEQGYVAECTGDNVFVVRDGRLITPPIAAGALAGVTRAVVCDLAREEGINTHEENMTRYDIYTADECFLTGTAAEIIPVVELDARKIHEGKVGPVTKLLTERFHELTRSTGTPIS
ncbi:MAG: branched-chain-amino-acid transaminase [Chthoniobacterales bacterium]